MGRLTDRQAAEFFHRSYTAVDGLWFVKLEQRYGFDTALDVDAEVWKVMPKIQARKLKELLGASDGLDGLSDCLTAKLEAEGFDFQAERDASGQALEVRIRGCPWQDLLAKSNRQHIADKVGQRICTIEYGVWAAEFGADIALQLDERLCAGGKACVLRFERR